MTEQNENQHHPGDDSVNPNAPASEESAVAPTPSEDPAGGAAATSTEPAAQSYPAPEQARPAPEQPYPAPEQGYPAPEQPYAAPEQQYTAPQPASGYEQQSYAAPQHYPTAPQPYVAPPASADAQHTTPLPPYGGQPYGTHQPADHHAASAFGPAATAPKEPRKRGGLPVVAALAVGALLGGASGAGVSYWVLAGNSSSDGGSGTPQTITVNDPADATATTAVAAAATPSVVTIQVAAQNGQGTGSGVVIDDEGHILTNAHVVTLDGAAGNATVTVQTSDGRLLEAQIVGVDPTADLAVIQVDPSADLPAIEFADSDDLNVGDTTIAIGAPLGLSGTVTTGIVSALNRSITVASSAAPEENEQVPEDDGQQEGDSPFDFWEFDIPGQDEQPQSQASSTISLSVIQTDAAINPGNSGGALLDGDGNLIGINVAIASAGGASGTAGSIGVGFAIPSNLAERIAQELIEDGTASHGLLGASVSDAASAEDAEITTVGALIQEVVADGAAEQAGLRPGDVVTEFNGHPITNSTDLTAQVRVLPAGATAELTFLRNGDPQTVEVTLGEAP